MILVNAYKSTLWNGTRLHLDTFVVYDVPKIIIAAVSTPSISSSTFVLCGSIVVVVVVLIFLATGPWGVSKLWGGDVPTSDRDPSGPRIRHKFIRSYSYYSRSTLSAHLPMSAQGGLLARAPHPLPFRPSCPHTGSFAHPSVTCLRSRIARPVSPCITLCYLPTPPHPRHTCRIPNSVPLSPPKSLLSCTQLLPSRRW